MSCCLPRGSECIVTTPTQPQLNLFWVWHEYSNEQAGAELCQAQEVVVDGS